MKWFKKKIKNILNLDKSKTKYFNIVIHNWLEKSNWILNIKSVILFNTLEKKSEICTFLLYTTHTIKSTNNRISVKTAEIFENIRIPSKCEVGSLKSSEQHKFLICF